MPLFKTITLPDGLIGVWQLTETSDEFIYDFSPEELANSVFEQYTYEKRKVEWLVIRILIKLLIGPDFTLSYSETRKPILHHHQFRHISISHSRDFLTVFIHKHQQVGIDIESISRNYDPIMKRYLSDLELIQVGKNPVLKCLYWCAKEAIFKLVPDEGIEFRTQIHVSPFNPDHDDHFSARFISGEMVSSFRLNFQVFAGHGMVWVAEENS